MESDVEVVNKALRSLGAMPIAALDQDHENARKMDDIYVSTLKAMLRSHPWNFNKKETALSLLAETPILEDFLYIYQLPSDFVRLNKTSVEPDYPHKIKGRKLYSNSATISIEYGYYCDDVTLWDDTFADAFSTRLAAEACYSITGKPDLISAKWQEFKEKYNLARSMNGQETTPDNFNNTRWLNSRV